MDDMPIEAEEFRMIWKEGLDKLTEALASRRLRHRDAAVFFSVVKYVNFKSGRAYVNASQIAEDLGEHRPHVSTSLGKLQKELFLVRCQDKASGNYYLLLNPYVCSVGGVQKRGFLWAQFQEALE